VYGANIDTGRFTPKLETILLDKKALILMSTEHVISSNVCSDIRLTQRLGNPISDIVPFTGSSYFGYTVCGFLKMLPKNEFPIISLHNRDNRTRKKGRRPASSFRRNVSIV
jgi:hypothetical protein